jgi:serine/threonine-protein kinase
MGSVWAAREDGAQSSVPLALKILHGGLELRPDFRKRLRREVEASRRVVHPAIVPVSELLEADGFIALVMERLVGETLRSRLDRDGTLDVPSVGHLFCQVASALRAAHAAGVVHRDLKPENLFLVQGEGLDHEVRLLDLGVAKLLDPSPPPGESALVTAFGTILGTVAYMAPEQVTGALNVDARADTWALGVVLYEALAGFRPIEGTAREEIIRRLLTDAIVPISALAPEVPPALATLVGRMLSRSPERRPSADEVERTLADLTKAEP